LDAEEATELLDDFALLEETLDELTLDEDTLLEERIDADDKAIFSVSSDMQRTETKILLK
jgi:hypothetical protein